MGFLDFLKREKTEEKPEAKKAAPAPKPSPKPGRTAESLQAEQLRLLRGTAILNGERLKGLRPERIADDLKKIDRARGLADLELKLAQGDSERKKLEKWKAGLGLLSGMYRAQVRENRGQEKKPAKPRTRYEPKKKS
ncbi:MAG: hypothetical protein MR009_05465 [Sutterellaceae bacterium]|nr:hypothetical protein [Sutterellaceae bacterium]MDD7443049.1 hypothetical protein [Sutterellaceae bacterium]MDY2867942.1 hypothetical protein [Mesosutterella sp.]